MAVLAGLGASIPFLVGGSAGHQSGQDLPIEGASTPQGAAADLQAGAPADLSAAAAATCEADYQAVQAAVQEYQAVNGRPPGSMAQLQSVLQGPVASSRFTIVIDRAHGQIDVALGGHPPRQGPANCAYAGPENHTLEPGRMPSRRWAHVGIPA